MTLSMKRGNLEQALYQSQSYAQVENMAAHVRQERRRRRNFIRRPRIFRDRGNPLEEYTAEEVFDRYRFRPDTVIYILGVLPNLQRPTGRNNPLPPLLQLLVCLRFFATGAIHLLIGDSLSISRSTAGRCIRDVSQKLFSLARNYINFPTGRVANDVKRCFSKIAGFPNVLGCIDGTFIRITRPRVNEGDFVNRKGYHALNVQMCCDPDYRVTSCNASWPGSVHDSRIFRTSALCHQFENGQHDGLLLGDTGYPCRSFLMVPFLAPASPEEDRFNAALCRTRVLIEQTFGILKRRFRLLHQEVITTPNRAVIYIICCVILHNVGINRGDIIDRDGLEEDDNATTLEMRNVGDGVAGDGIGMRRHIVDTFFT